MNTYCPQIRLSIAINLTSGVLAAIRAGDGAYMTSKAISVIEQLSALTLNAVMGVLAFCTSGQIQQLGQRINMCFTIHNDQALHTIRGIFQVRHQCMHRQLLRLLVLHDLRPHEQITMTSRA